MQTWLIAASLVLVVSTAAEATEMRFSIAGRRPDCFDCGWIVGQGAITLDTANRLTAFLERETLVSAKPRVEFNSNGGSLLGALKLGRVIRERKLATRVAVSRTDRIDANLGLPNESLPGARCMAACAFAFLGGIERRIGTDAVLAIGNFSREVAFFKPAASLFDALELPLGRVMEGILLKYVVDMGIDPRLVALAAQTPPGEARSLSQEELAAFGIVAPPGDEADRTRDPDLMGAWKIGAHRRGVVAFSRSADGLTQVTLYCNAGARSRHYAIVRSEKPEISARIHEYAATFEGRTAFGRPLGRSALRYNDDDENGDGIRIVLPQIDFDEIEETTSISFDDGESKDPLSMTLPADGLKEATELAFKNCLR